MGGLILFAVAGFVVFGFIPLIGPLQEVEIAHCIISGLLGSTIVLISAAIQKLNKVINLLTSSQKKTNEEKEEK